MAHAKPPRGPTPRAGRRLKGVGGWVSPLGDSLEWGAPRKGGSKGGNQGGGRAARPCATSRPADLHHFGAGGGRAAAQGRGSHCVRRRRRRRGSTTSLPSGPAQRRGATGRRASRTSQRRASRGGHSEAPGRGLATSSPAAVIASPRPRCAAEQRLPLPFPAPLSTTSLRVNAGAARGHDWRATAAAR